MDVTRIIKATPIEFERDLNTASVFERILRGCLRHAEWNAKLIDLTTPDACHQTRISLRRARSAVWLFKDHLDKAARKPLNAALRKAGQQLSPLRDWDVFVSDTLPKLAKREKAAWMARLRDAAEAVRQSKYQNFTVDIPQPSFCQLFGQSPTFTSILETAPDMLDEAYFTVRRRYRQVATPENRHELRKTMKKLRYGIEFFGQLYEPKRVKSYLDRCKEMQDVLGEINDAQTMLHLLQGLDEVPKDWLNGAEQRENKAVDHLAKHIAAFRDARPFWD